ncbi:hypothetical protein GW17_00010621, partial [Ensete ventricosum]
DPLHVPAGVATSDSGVGGSEEEEEGGEGSLEAERQHDAGVGCADSHRHRRGALLQELGSALVLLPPVDPKGLGSDWAWPGPYLGMPRTSIALNSAVDRPGKASKVRKHWNRYHHYAGRAAVVCAVANIFYGFTIFMEISRCASEE